MKKYLYLSIGAIIIIMIVTIVFLSKKIDNLQYDIGVYDNNFKALNLEKDSLSNLAIAYKFDIEQLNYIRDSLLEDLNTTRKKLKIKDDQLKQMQYIKIETNTKDSIYFRDTVFKENIIQLDTLVSNDWYQIKVELDYPSKLKLDARYTSAINVFASTSKEIIGVPKKCKIGRLFQKKQKVIRVDVIDKNPYSIIKEKRFIIID